MIFITKRNRNLNLSQHNNTTHKKSQSSLLTKTASSEECYFKDIDIFSLCPINTTNTNIQSNQQKKKSSNIKMNKPNMGLTNQSKRLFIKIKAGESKQNAYNNKLLTNQSSLKVSPEDLLKSTNKISLRKYSNKSKRKVDININESTDSKFTHNKYFSGTSSKQRFNICSLKKSPIAVNESYLNNHLRKSSNSINRISYNKSRNSLQYQSSPNQDISSISNNTNQTKVNYEIKVINNFNMQSNTNGNVNNRLITQKQLNDDVNGVEDFHFAFVSLILQRNKAYHNISKQLKIDYNEEDISSLISL